MTASQIESDVANLSLAPDGVKRTEWAEREMPVLRLIREQFRRDRPLEGQRLAACLHVTSETANLAVTLKARMFGYARRTPSQRRTTSQPPWLLSTASRSSR